jgi:hypothetical protein
MWVQPINDDIPPAPTRPPGFAALRRSTPSKGEHNAVSAFWKAQLEDILSLQQETQDLLAQALRSIKRPGMGEETTEQSREAEEDGDGGMETQLLLSPFLPARQPALLVLACSPGSLTLISSLCLCLCLSMVTFCLFSAQPRETDLHVGTRLLDKLLLHVLSLGVSTTNSSHRCKWVLITDTQHLYANRFLPELYLSLTSPRSVTSTATRPHSSPLPSPASDESQPLPDVLQIDFVSHRTVEPAAGSMLFRKGEALHGRPDEKVEASFRLFSFLSVSLLSDFC